MSTEDPSRAAFEVRFAQECYRPSARGDTWEAWQAGRNHLMKGLKDALSVELVSEIATHRRRRGLD